MKQPESISPLTDDELDAIGVTAARLFLMSSWKAHEGAVAIERLLREVDRLREIERRASLRDHGLVGDDGTFTGGPR